MNDIAAEITEDDFLKKVAAVCAMSEPLTPLGAAILLAADLGIANDTRAFARILGLEHALVLRAVTELAGENAALVRIADRNKRNQRTTYALTDAATALIASAERKI